MMKIKRWISVIFLFTFLSVSLKMAAQEGGNYKELLSQAKELYENDAFVSSEKLLEQTLLLFPELTGLSRSEVEAYRVMCAIKLERSNIDGIVADFEDKYPYSPELATIKFLHSKYYFGMGNYSRSLELLNSLKSSHLPKEDKAEYSFDIAYCNMRVGNNVDAVSGFKEVIAMKQNPYTSSATYYLAYIHYINKEFEDAISFFGRLVKDDRYSLFSQYFLLESNFMLKNYRYVIEKGEKVLNLMTDDYKMKVARILSEAYFALEMPTQAKEYFEQYSASGANLSRKDNYYSGIVSYTLNSFYPSIDAFGKVANKEDSLGQSAYYYLGNSYLKIKNKHNALDAFKAASECDFDITIKEEAFFNYAKLAFDLNSDIVPFNNYLKEFPSSVKSDEINNYIATSFLLNKNYKSAIIALNKIKYLRPPMAMNLQKAAFFRAIQLFERGAYSSAITDFKIALKNGAYNQALTLLTNFWMAEAYYRSNKFQEAIDINLNLIKNSTFRSSAEYPLSLFNLGYAYFRMEDFESAVLWFRQYLELTPSKRSLTVEAQTRLADSYFMLKDYERAAELFDMVASKNYDYNDIYAAYQGAVAYGLISMEDKKIEMLKDIIDNKPESVLYPKAVYELGRTYVQISDNENAVYCFNVLLESVSDSTYHAKALIELGMINANLANYDEALKYYSLIIDDYPLSEEAQNALAGIETIYQLQNKPEEYLAYLDRIGMSSIKSADEKELMFFNSAEQIFLSGGYNEALNALRSFVENYPDGAKTTQAYFYLGETLNKIGKPEEAAEAYHKVMMMGEGSFAELSTLYYGRICFRLEKYDKAIEAYETLSRVAKLENNKFEALVGKMRSYYRNGDFGSAVTQASNLLASDVDVSDYDTEANYIIAKSYLALGKREKATPVLKKLAENSTSAEGAEAAYLLILDAYDEGNFSQVENLVYTLSDSKTPQNYWLAKSFIVLGDSFAERDEWEQAIATFMSIKEGYVPINEHDDVLDQVEVRIKKIEDMQPAN